MECGIRKKGKDIAVVNMYATAADRLKNLEPKHKLSDQKSRTQLNRMPYLEGQGDLVSKLISPITHIVTLVILIINLLTKSP